MVVALSGLVATGKSSVARAIARQIAAPAISSDATSEFMIRSGAESKDESVHELDWERSFRAGFREEVYDEVFRRAEVVLASGRPVVIDGCFGTRALRSRARELAKRFGTPFFFVECTAAEPVLRQRLCERSRSAGLDPNAWQKIFDDFSALWEPVEELASSEHVILDTGQSLDINVRILEDILPVWPEALQ
jgi:predicted kinase